MKINKINQENIYTVLAALSEMPFFKVLIRTKEYSPIEEALAKKLSIHRGMLYLYDSNSFQYEGGTDIPEVFNEHFLNPIYFKDFLYFSFLDCSWNNNIYFIHKKALRNDALLIEGTRYKIKVQYNNAKTELYIPIKSESNLKEKFPELLKTLQQKKDTRKKNLEDSTLNYFYIKTKNKGLHIIDSSFSTKNEKNIAPGREDADILMRKASDAFSDENFIKINSFSLDGTLFIRKGYLLKNTMVEKTQYGYEIDKLSGRFLFEIDKKEMERLDGILKIEPEYSGWKLYGEV